MSKEASDAMEADTEEILNLLIIFPNSCLTDHVLLWKLELTLAKTACCVTKPPTLAPAFMLLCLAEGTLAGERVSFVRLRCSPIQ
jgi:hypothetical protein